MKIFIGSSTESRGVAEVIAENIESLGHDPVPWYDPTTFSPGQYIFESLEKISEKVDAAIFIFGEDDKKWYRGHKFTLSVRGNVLLEYGLFRGVLKKSNTLICTNGNPELDSDLDGVIHIDFNKPHNARTKIKDWLNNHINLNYMDILLMADGGECLLTIPAHNYNKNDPNQVYTRDQDVRLALEMRDILKRTNITFNENNKTNFGTVIHFGSPLICPHVNLYIKRRLPDFKWYVTDETFDNFYDQDVFNRLPFPDIRESSKDHWTGYKFGGNEFEYIHERQDWAFLLRLGKENFPEEPKTVHVLFGIGEAGRKGAVEYFLKNFKIIINEYGSKDYLLAARVSYPSGKPLEFGCFRKNYLDV
jgi:hypothetical protein